MSANSDRLLREQVAYQAQMEHLRAAEGRSDVEAGMVTHLRQDLAKARRAMELAFLDYTTTTEVGP